MWRREMRQIVDALKKRLDFRHDAQIADAVGLSRQHLHLAVRENRLVPDKLLQFCINKDIDITRLLRDGKAVTSNDIDNSDTSIDVSEYEEGSVIPNCTRNIPIWFAEIALNRKIETDESISYLRIESDEMEPKIPRGTIAFLDRSVAKPQGGHFYLNLRGYGVVRRIMKATDENKWYLLTSQSELTENKPLDFGGDFSIIGRIQFASCRI